MSCNASELVKYARALKNSGYTSLRAMARLTPEDIQDFLPEIPAGHKRLLLYESAKLRTPIKQDVSSDADESENTALSKLKTTHFVNHAGGGSSNNSCRSIAVWCLVYC